MSLYMGIDPGKDGGFGILDERGEVIDAFRMPDTSRDIWTAVVEAKSLGVEFAYLEKLAPVPTIGGKKKKKKKSAKKPGISRGSQASFKIGKSAGMLEAFLVAADIPYELVSPVKWKRVMGVTAPKGATDTQKKNIDKAKAQQLFPTVKMTHAKADALLITEYGRRDRAMIGSVAG